jgi:hypothetical protein
MEGKLSNCIKISIYKHVQIYKNKESETLRDRDEVTCGTGLEQCRALKPSRVGLRSQGGPVGWLVQLPLCMRFFFLF